MPELIVVLAFDVTVAAGGQRAFRIICRVMVRLSYVLDWYFDTGENVGMFLVAAFIRDDVIIIVAFP